jgi:hypothetical protein
MQTSELIAAIEEEIARMEQARALLSGSGAGPAHGGRRAAAPSGGPAPRKKRTISAAGRARIAAAQKARWAGIRKAARRAEAATAAKAAARTKKRKAAKKASATKVKSRKKADSRRVPTKAVAPATPPAAAESSAS